MTLEIKVAASLMKYNFYEQSRILDAIEHGLEGDLPTTHLREGAAKVIEVFDNHEPVVEGYAGFPVERDHVAKKKSQHSDDRNVGRVIRSGGESYLITGRKTDGRYQIVGKDGKKTAKAPEDIGLNLQREDMVVGVDIEDLHQMMVEKKMDGVDDNGFTKCWKGYVKRGTKMKGGKEVNDCVKEAAIDEAKRAMVKVAVNPKKLGYKVADVGPDGKERNVKTYGAMKKEEYVDEALTGERYKKAVKKPGGIAYSRMVSADPKKRATRGGRGGESDFGAGDRGSGNKAARRAGTYQEEYVDEATAMAKRGYDEAPIRSKIAKSTGGGKSADRATALADRETYGNKEKKAGRENLARKQRGDFRNTTSSSPGLHGYGHKSDDPKVKAKQAARGAQRGALTPNEKKSLNREEFDAFIESVIMDEEFDTLTFDELHDICVEALLEIETEEMLTEALECIDQLDLLTEVMDRGEIQRRRDQAKDRLATGAAMKKASDKSSSSDSPAGGRREKFKAALKTAASAVRKGIVGGAKLAGKAAGHAKNLAKDAASAASDGYKSTQSSTSSSGSGTGGSDSDSDTSSSTSAKKPSAPAQKPGDSSKKGPGIASKIKKGIKKVVGVGSRAVAKASGYVAKRLGEESKYDWRKEIMGDK